MCKNKYAMMLIHNILFVNIYYFLVSFYLFTCKYPFLINVKIGIRLFKHRGEFGIHTDVVME